MIMAAGVGLALLLNRQAPIPVRLKPGDVLSVFVATADAGQASREMTVLSDGYIYGIGFGRLKVSELTPDDAQKGLRHALAKLYRPDDVFLTILKQRSDLAYVVGANSPGPVELPPTPITLRQILPPVTGLIDSQRLNVELIRGGQILGKSSYSRALEGDDALGNMRILPNDLVSIFPQENVRVWVVGPVKTPGQLVLPAGSTVYQAVASAGGVQSLESDTRLSLRHGPDTTEYPATPDAKVDAPKLMEGDVITVVAPQLIRISVAGKVNKPDQFVLSSGTTVLQAITHASGLLPEASLSRVFLFRNGEVMQYNFTALTQGGSVEDPKLIAGDLVYVDENRKSFFVFGHVAHTGRYLMEDGKAYRATDALAQAGGLDERGSMRRVFLYHPNPNGKATITQFNLDEYLKDGKQSSNPVIGPGDAMLFSEPKGLTFASAIQALTAYFYVHTVVKP